jgi:hypothetical protein
MDRSLSAACQLDVRSHTRSGKPLLDDAVLGPRRIGPAPGPTLTLAVGDVLPSLASVRPRARDKNEDAFGLGERDVAC